MFGKGTIAASLFLVLASLSEACPPSSWVRHEPVVLQFRRLPVALLVEPVCGLPTTAGSDGFDCRERVVEVIHDSTGLWHKDGMVNVALRSQSDEASQWLVMGNYDPAVPDWETVTTVSPALIEFLKAAPDLETDPEALVQHLVRHLEHDDPLVAAAAFDALEYAFPQPYITTLSSQSVAAILPRDKLRELVQNPEKSTLRLGLYGVMLGFCGNDEDVKLMEQRVVETGDNDYRLGIEGVMAGYLLLTGERGLATIDNTKLEDEKAPFGESYAALQALRFMWQYGDGKIPPERLKQSLRLLLARPALADVVIADLARWKDWAVMEDLMKLYGEGEYNVPSIKRAIIRYMFAAMKDVPMDAKETDPLPAHAAAAKKHLETLRAQDPKLVKDVKRFLR